jgi:hypothetical protein
MPFDETLIALNYVLAGLYPFKDESFRIVTEAGDFAMHVAFKDSAIDNWFQILFTANNRGKVKDLVRVALKEHPENSVLIQAEKGAVAPATGPAVVDWQPNLTADGLEQLMGGQPTFLPVSFLQVGLERARSVARVYLPDGSTGTGFLTTNNVFVTNNHVFPNAATAAMGTLQFNYQLTARGLDEESTAFQLDPSRGFKTSTEDDWTFVRVKGDANADWGAIDIESIDPKKAERVNIIQHPSGGPKQIAIYNNVVAYVDDNRIQYLTDTLPGSSGSPVFDAQWRLVALHHSGGWIVEPLSKKTVFRNEGININRVLSGLTESGLLNA